MAAPEGYFVVPRKSLAALAGDPQAVALWVLLLARARFRAGAVNVAVGRGRLGKEPVVLGVGELLFGRKAVAEASGLSEKVVWSRLNKLIRLGFVRVVERNNLFSVLKIVTSVDSAAAGERHSQRHSPRDSQRHSPFGLENGEFAPFPED